MELKAADIMTPHVVIATPDMGLVEAGKLMNRFRIGGLPVVDKTGKLISIITERCIMKGVIAVNKKPGSLKVKDVMVKSKMVTGSPGESIKSIAEKMHEFDKARIPIVDKEGKLLGIITNKDIVEHSPTLTNLVLEQAKMEQAYGQFSSSVSFGRCEHCGGVSDLFFREEKFLCGTCAGVDKPKSKPWFSFFGK